MTRSTSGNPSSVPYLVSACLLGLRTTFDERINLAPVLVALAAQGRVVPICPEVAGGLPTPRPPAEIVGGDGHDVWAGTARVVTIDGEDVTAAFCAGAERALVVARQHGITTAILKARSPSCGCQHIHDGTFTEALIRGVGVAAAWLQQHGLTVWSEEDQERIAELRIWQGEEQR
ncbi:MAG: DUF523 domain-containing protein [Chloroflexi bacterium]|nr:DUF523 domain-containing protein [Chloroflexota bacterium]MBU1751825.1 DUF523 domain-containing protein [Chloroflexota bacterium]MBU1877886.1 DUF523 domain-containing protein [Chloroflexota bacterium]